MDSAILFSYPRSGNTWVRYIIEVLTGRPTLGTPDNLLNDPPIWARFQGLPVNSMGDPVALKRHTLIQIDEEDRTRPLIVVVRNYKESIIRVRNHSEESLRKFDFETERLLYFAPVEYYHRHDRKKLLLYYEDLINRPASVIIEIGAFFGLRPGDCDFFLENYLEHRHRSVDAYAPTSSGSHTRGQTTIFHSLSLSTAERERWDHSISSLDTEIYRKYLSRYREHDEASRCESNDRLSKVAANE